MLVCAFGGSWRACKRLVGCFLKCFWWEFFLLVFSLIGHLLGQSPLYFLLISSPCFSVLNFTYYIYTILLELLSCNFISFVSILMVMTITYRNNFWLYIFFAWTWILLSEIRSSNNFLSFCDNHWLKFDIICFLVQIQILFSKSGKNLTRGSPSCAPLPPSPSTFYFDLEIRIIPTGNQAKPWCH